MTEPKQPSQETESLVKRLAGPSTGKAGYCILSIYYAYTPLIIFLRLSKDQTEINRIIAEASKGSKFYEVRAIRRVCAGSHRSLGRMKKGKTRS